MKQVILLINFILFVAHFTIASPHVTRNYVSRYYTTRDGLVQMQVGCIYQDRDGYMWFGTKNGASRFDGITFKNYTVRNGLPAGEINFISGWDDKIVMLSSQKLIIIFPNDSIHYLNIPNCEDLGNFKFNTLKLINDHQIILFNVNTIDKKQNVRKCIHLIYNIKTNKFTEFNLINGYVNYIDNKTLITLNTIYDIDQNFRKKKIADIPKSFSFILADLKKQFFYFENGKNVSKFKLINNKFEFVESIIETEFHSYIQFITLNDESLLYFDGDWKSYFYPKRDVNLGVDLTIVNYMLVDRENNLWIGTDAGVYNFFNLNIEEFRLNLAKTDNIWSILEDDNRNMWFGSYGSGLWKLDSENKLSLMNKGFHEWRLQYMNSIKTKSGTLYFTSGGGLTKYENNKLESFGKTGPCLSVFYDEAKKNILFSGFDSLKYRGLYCSNENKKQFFEVKKGLPRAIIKDSKGQILLGSARGLSYFTGDSVIEDTRSHTYQGVISLAIDSSNRIWKGTENGVYAELPNGSEYRLAMNRITDPIYSIMVYHNKYVLAGGIRCLYIIEIDDLKSYSNPEMWEIGYDAGFTGLESGQNGFCEDHNGDVWLTTALSVIKFNPDKLVQSQKQIIPPIRIAKLYFSSDNVVWEQIVLPITKFTNGSKNSIKLPAENKFLRFEFIANSITAPKSLRFKYRLKGFSDDWSGVVYTKYIDFTNLGYGNYQFEVICSLDGIHWSEFAFSPIIEIETPFLQSTIAYVIYFILSSLLITVITLLIVRQKNKKKIDLLNRQKYENELQLSTLRSKVIPHFTKNVLSAIGNFAMTNRVKASYYISIFSNFTQQTLSNADKNYINIYDELDYLKTYLELEKMRFGQRFDFVIDVDENVQKDIILPSMTLHTYCDNAIRHGLVNKKGNGILTLKIFNTYDGVLFEITDNGIGRLRAAELGTRGNGQGLKLVQAQLDFYNQLNKRKIIQNIVDVTDIDGNALGTKVELFVPNDYKFKIE